RLHFPKTVSRLIRRSQRQPQCHGKSVWSTVRRSGAGFACSRTFVLVSLMRCAARILPAGRPGSLPGTFRGIESPGLPHLKVGFPQMVPAGGASLPNNAAQARQGYPAPTLGRECHGNTVAAITGTPEVSPCLAVRGQNEALPNVNWRAASRWSCWSL